MSSDAEITREFFSLVNMSPSALADWLESEASRSVGWDSGDGESVGHKSVRRIVAITRKRRGELTDADRRHMRKVVGYIHRHGAQRPEGDVTDTPWRWSLMNWGHDPLKPNHG